MTRFPFFTLFMIFIVVLWIRHKTLDKQQAETERNFWEKEREANTTPAVDISTLPFIKVPLDRFPIHSTEDPAINSIEDKIIEISTHKLLNLTGKTNTELKATYGVPNFEEMSKIGEDFDSLTILLNQYAESLINAELLTEAISVLEFAAGIKTDTAKTYKMLADCYSQKGNTQKLDILRDQVDKSNLVLKPAILEHIDNLIKPVSEDFSN